MKRPPSWWLRIAIVVIALAGAFSYGRPGVLGFRTPPIAGHCAGLEVFGHPGAWIDTDC